MAEQRVPTFRAGERARYVMDNRSFGAFMKSDQMRDVTAEVAEDIMKAAIALTQVGDDKKPHKRMIESYRVVKQAGFIKVGRNVRVQVKVVNDDPYAAAEEFGGKYNKRRRMLGRAGAMFGDLKSKDGKVG